MNGIHDLGGMQGFGVVVAEPEKTEPVFHAEWEKTVAGIVFTFIRQSHWSLDRFRKTLEDDSPLNYLSHSYYQRWLDAVETLIVDYGLVTRNELETGKPSDDQSGSTSAHWSPSFESPDLPRYRAGDRVRASNIHPISHTRLPRYVRGRTGVVINHAGAEPLPELAAEGICGPQNLYMVRFEAKELWGHDHDRQGAVYLELWDDYLEPDPGV